MATIHKEKRRLERLKKDLDSQQQKLANDRKKLQAEQNRISAQKRELNGKLKKIAAHQNQQGSNHRKGIEHKLRQEIKELKSDSQITKRHLRRTRSDLDTANTQIKVLKKGLHQQENIKNTLDVIDALNNDKSAVSLDEIIQNTNANKSDKEWNKALKELSKIENDSSQFLLCNELLNEMVLRQEDLECLRQAMNTNTHDMDHIYHCIESRHTNTMQKIQQMVISDADLFSNIQDNNQKWLNDIQQFMSKLNCKKEVEDICIDEDLKRRLDRKRKQTVNNELEAIFTEILLNEGRNANESNDTNESKYDELNRRYAKLKAEHALQAMFENEYKKILNELMKSKKINQTQKRQHKQKCQQYDAVLNKCNKANNRASNLQKMYQSEYEKVLNELIERRQNDENTTSKITDLQTKYDTVSKQVQQYKNKHSKLDNEYDVLSNLMDATKGENECLMQQLTELKHVQSKYKNMENEYQSKCKECEQCNDELNEIREQQSALQIQHNILQNKCKSLELQCETIETEYTRKHREYLNCKRDLNKITETHSALKRKHKQIQSKCYDIMQKHSKLYNELTQTKSNHKLRIKQLQEVYESEYANLLKEFNDYKHDNNMSLDEIEHIRNQMEELKKQNKFMKQKQTQIQQIYEAEYEKLLKEFTNYKQTDHHTQ